MLPLDFYFCLKTSIQCQPYFSLSEYFGFSFTHFGKDDIKHYQGFIKENYKDRLGRTATLEFSNDYILAKDNGSESKVLTTEVEEIFEIPTTIFVRLKGGQSFILPKDKISNIDNVTTRLKELADYLKIKYERDDNWKWK